MGELHKQLLQLNFYPRPPRGGRHAHISIPAPFAQFLSTPSARRATVAGCFDGTDKTYFYPRPPRGGRHTSVPSLSQAWIFLSTPSARRATYDDDHVPTQDTISIHALREEGDGRHPVLCCFGYYFYPRPPRGGRLLADRLHLDLNRFLSTPSARRATCRVIWVQSLLEFLSTPSARRATLN